VFEIGYSLRAARERQGIGLPEAELATKIRVKYIRALEEEDFATLPADTYTRGFLRAYADYLGLDGEIYVDEYASRFHNNEWDDEPRPGQRSRPQRPRRERTIERRAVLLVLASIGVITALVIGAWKWGDAPSPGTSGHKKHHGKHHVRHELVLHGVGKGTYVVVHRGSKRGPVLFSGTLAHGRKEPFFGRRFYVSELRPAGVRMSHSPGVTVLGG
jgi:hypothetical protein